MITAVTDVERVSTERLEAEVQTLAGHLAAATCRWLLMVAELDRREAWRSWEVASMAHWLSWKCGVSLTAGRDHVRVARALEYLPLVREKFACGALSYSKARALCRLVSLREMEADLVGTAEVATAAQLDRIAAGYRKAQHFADPDRDQRNHERHDWNVVTDDDAMSTLKIKAPSDVIAEIVAAVDAAVKQEVPADAAEKRQRRVDALAVIARHYLQPDATQPVPTTIVVREEPGVAPAQPEASDAAPMDSDAGTVPEPDLVPPARMHGLPITRSAYERLRCDASIATEQVLPDGSVARSPLTSAIPRRIRRAVRQRDMNTCRWPGCTHSAHLHIHHIVYRVQCGRHTISNLVSLCSHHHTVVHLGLWTLTGDANGRLLITGRDGRVLREVDEPVKPATPRQLVRANRRGGLGIDERTISGAYNEPLHLHWAVAVICGNEEVRRRRN